VLSEAELEHLATISAPNARAQYAIGRATIRLLGAQASGRHPESLAITASEAGKPRFADLQDLNVSVAHTGRVVAVAACPSAAVGVDIEPALTTADDPRRLAGRLFAESEVASLQDVSDADVADWFSTAWTIKESVGKALGVGMIPALSGAVTERRADGLALAAVWSGPPAESWTLHQLKAPGSNEKIAVAVPAPGVALGPVSEFTPQELSNRHN
jgi:4'-phosphopantetheinyl transferase